MTGSSEKDLIESVAAVDVSARFGTMPGARLTRPTESRSPAPGPRDSRVKVRQSLQTQKRLKTGFYANDTRLQMRWILI
jgi:hypothetical protein